jgi:Ca2+/Na+ antiporter
MGNGDERKALERYARNFVVLMVLGGVVLSLLIVPVSLNHHTWWAILAVLAYAIVGTVVLIRGARARVRANAAAFAAPLDDKARKKYRGNIRFFQFCVAVLALLLVNYLWQARGTSFLSELPGICINLLLQAYFVWLIRVMQRKLRQRLDRNTPNEQQSLSQNL